MTANIEWVDESVSDFVTEVVAELEQHPGRRGVVRTLEFGRSDEDLLDLEQLVMELEAKGCCTLIQSYTWTPTRLLAWWPVEETA